MQKLLNKIDKLAVSIQSDITRAQLPELSLLLVELSVIFGDAKRDVIRTKGKHERELVMKKERRERELNKAANGKYIVESVKNPKAKKDKVTNTDIERHAEFDLIKLKEKIEEPTMIIAYLDPILRQYQDLINSWKHEANQKLIPEPQNQKIDPRF